MLPRAGKRMIGTFPLASPMFQVMLKSLWMIQSHPQSRQCFLALSVAQAVTLLSAVKLRVNQAASLENL
jgi:hypothetical protein